VVLLRECQEGPPIRSRVGGDTAQLAFVEEVPLVVEWWHVRQVDARHGECSAAIEGGESRWDQFPSRREQDRGVQWFRRWVGGRSGG
jgi:hypothetical protein